MDQPRARRADPEQVGLPVRRRAVDVVLEDHARVALEDDTEKRLRFRRLATVEIRRKLREPAFDLRRRLERFAGRKCRVQLRRRRPRKHRGGCEDRSRKDGCARRIRGVQQLRLFHRRNYSPPKKIRP